MQDPSFARYSKKPSVVLPSVSIKPQQKLQPMRLENSSIKKTIVEPLEKQSKLRYAKQAIELETDKKIMREANCQASEHETKFQQLLKERLERSEKESMEVEQVMDRKVFQAKRSAIEEKKLQLSKEYLDCLLE